MKRKLLILMCIVATILFATTVSINAEEEVPTSPTPLVEYSVSFKYTTDSTHRAGLSYENYLDPVSNEQGFKILVDLPIGHIIYDNPDTDFIDGIRINGETISSLKVAVKDDTSEYVVDVRTVYAKGILGDIARMSDGTYDWTKLLENPIMILQLAYWALAIVTVLIGLIASLFGKKLKVKNADEIAASVTDATEASIGKVEARITEAVLAEVSPVLQTILKDIENIVKAVTISASNSKNAPLALLDVLQDTVKSGDVPSLIDDIRKTIQAKVEASEACHADNVATLHAIAHPESSDAVIDNATEAHDDVKPVF